MKLIQSLFMLSLPVIVAAQTRTLNISGPSQVYAGQSFTVTTSASTNAGGGEQIGFYHGQYSTNGGATWTWFTADVNAGTSASRNAWITAGGAGSTILVWVKTAFRGGPAGDVDYNGGAINWGGSWGTNATPPAKTISISVVAPPNQAPTITWTQAPASAWVNQWFAVQARGNDANGNLSSVSVWREGVPFAFNNGGNGWENYSDANSTYGSSAGSVTFQARSGDSAGATSPTIYHTVTINNRAPSGTFTVNGSTGNSSITFGQTVAVASSVSDPDGNMNVHSFWWDQGSGLTWTHPYLTWSYPPNTDGWFNLNLGSNGYDASNGSSSTRGFDFRPTKAATFIFHNVAADPHAWVGVGASVIYLTVNKATPTASFADRSLSPSGGSYTVQVGDLNASFANPHSGAVAAPTGSVTYSIVGSGAAVGAGTVLPAGSAYTIRASYSGNSNYNATTKDAVWTISQSGQTITFAQPPNKVYGDAPFALSASASSGLPVTLTVLSGPATISGSTLTITGVGTVTVRASQAGNTSFSAAANVDRSFTVSKASQTITFAQPPNKVYGDAPFGLSASASSGLPVTLTIISGPATLSGSTLTITGTGTVTVRASQAGNANYNAATNVDRSFTVSKANQTITFAQPPNKVYGDAPFALSSSASSGLPVTLAVISGPATLSGSTLTITGTGTVTVRASQAGNANYNAAANVDRSFTVANANQTITFNQPPAQTYGTPLTLSATASSGLTVSFSILSGPATLSGNTVTFTGNGNVTVRASQAGNGYYNAAPNVDRTFSVSGAPNPPTVSLTAPANGASFTAPASLTLTATAADTDGSITKVEFFQNGVKIGEKAAAPYTQAVVLGSPGSYTFMARAIDNGTNATDSTPVAITVNAGAPVLPFVSGFEPGEGYALGALHNQVGWSATSGSVVTDADYMTGARSALLPGNNPALQLSRSFPTHAGESVVFADLFLLPHASSDTGGSARVALLDAAQVAFLLDGGVGRFYVFNGDGAGGGQWQPSPGTVSLDGQGYAADWVRLTLRLDYAAHKWDLSVGGTLVASDVSFLRNTQNTLGSFTLTGRLTATTMLDDILAGFTNPVFADTDKDGMPDAWESTVGLNPLVNDRNGDPDFDGVSNITEYRLGTNPTNADPSADTDGDGLTDAQEASVGTSYLNADTDGDGLPDGWEVIHTLNPLAPSASGNPDGDSLTNLQEYMLGSNPNNALDATASPPAGYQLVLPVPPSQYFKVNTTSWSIAPL